jgi:hypothetical protein
VRIVVGYNPYRRPSGPLYYEVPSGGTGDPLGPAPGGLPCVSPGNLLSVHLVKGRLTQTEGRCPATFTPRTASGFRSRLTFGLAIGQAF